ncbi:fatty acid synthase isoform X2 [Solenopsis invicta]|uniref:fatty acid synthase isoform X2 n=1 Tax=Solenopsis invicta TaxID=13686 RepID=UPI000E33DDE6|nr:fatty acid synthase isoform X2 [Solenopsis invicta]XP_039312543.1 fatty acid synthase isoform X2 [Solenopsis invicta]
MDNKKASKSWNSVESGEEIVISGISGRFPNSDNIHQLRENLFNKVSLIRADHGRWKIDHPDLPNCMGTINNVEKFDADFFGLSFEQAHIFSPEMRLLLEHSYEAIIDAGINPKQLRGKNTAVIIGTSFIEMQEKCLYENIQTGDLNIVGCSKSAVANVLSHFLNLKGPSQTIDTACSSSLSAMAVGYENIMSGKCEDAIIGSTNMCFHPIANLQFARLGVLSADGDCRPFDIAADGYSRSETVAVVYLQKAKNAKRIYAICPHIKLNSDGYKKEGITYPSSLMQSTLLKEFYDECGIPISCLDYIEAHGTATKVGDLEEINAIQKVMCKNRETPLMIGSVKSNLGHAEPASGFTQIAKVLIALEAGFVPPNIKYTSPRNDIEALLNGTVRVVEQTLPLKNGFIGINSFGFGGANAHMLLKWNPKQKINNRVTDDDLPRLVILSGRTEEAVKLFLNDVAGHSTDAEYIRLLHDVYADNIDGHSWRGFIVLNNLQQEPIKEIQNCESVRRPVCFIFSALGSQWPGMGRNLLKFHIFANAIKKCDEILKSYGISVTDILSNKDEKMCQNALYAFVGIVAVQIGLVDVLTSLGIIPNYMIGYSAGELGCAYADKCLTIEQTILSAYFISLACIEEKIIHSSMAFVSLNYESLKNMCPADIEIICRNSESNSVVCGPTESVQKFIKKLQLNNVHVKKICCNVPYHSSYLASVKTQLLLNLSKIIPQPKKRSSKWISSSIPRFEWSSSVSNLSSADYHTRSILNTVLLEQTTHLIPTNAVIIEIAPNNVLQDVLKKSLHPKVANIVLNQRTEKNIEVILQGIGRLYNYGLQPQVANLYPAVEFPVSRGTPMISPSIRWDHSENWFTPSYKIQKHAKFRERYIEISLEDEDFDFMGGHVIDGRNLLPATGYLVFVWQTIGMIKGQIYTTIPIVFQDVSFIRATHLSKKEVTKLKIMIQKDGKFEITEGNNIVVTGTVYETSNPEQEINPIDKLPQNNDEEEHMTARDIYKELKLRGYQYSGLFRGLHSSSISCNKGHIIWKGNWVTFMDTMLQMHIIRYDTRDLYVPTSIQKLVIDPSLHASKLQDEGINVTTNTNKSLLPIQTHREIDMIIAGGIEIRGLKATQISRRKLAQDAVIEEHVFVAHHDQAILSLNEAIRISAQLALEDHQIIKVKAIELVEDVDDVTPECLSSSLLIEAFSDMPLIQANITLLTSPSRFSSVDLSPNILIDDLNKRSVDDEVLMVAGFNLLTKQQTSLERLLPFLKEGGYLLTREKCDVNDYNRYLQQYQLNVILEKRTDKEMIVLMKKKVQIEKKIIVYVRNDNFNWLDDLKLLVSDENKLKKTSRIILVGEGDSECGLLGFVNCLRKEPGGEYVRGVLIQDKASKFSLQDPFYMQQLQKDMVINVLRSNGTWGSYRHLRLSRPEANHVPSAHVYQMVRGDLSTFRWIENNVSVEFNCEDLVRVVYSPLNFRDVMLATGKLIFNQAISQGRLFQNVPLGLEYVGFDANGQRVMGLRDTNCIANVVVKDKDLCWKIPDAWTFEEAATVPCVYSTVYMALYIQGKMKKGNKILIHSGTGGIGQAAIHLALEEGCEVFTTVGTHDKRNFIKEIFPTILDEHIGNSRDTSFEEMIMRHTNGRGVDIVLNSLAEEKLLASVRCLAQNGRFLEIGKFDLLSNNPLGMLGFKKGISFHGVLLDNMITGNHKYKSLLFKMVADGLENETIKPIQVKVFPKTEIEQAFRYMTSGKHMGKIIINIQEKNKPLDEPIMAYRRYYCLRDKSYVIVGGLGGLGLELTDWLILRGARNIILISRTGLKNGYQRMKIQLWKKKYGVNVLIVKNIDVADPKDCEYLLQTAEKEAPVDAIFNLGVVLKDGVLKNQTVDTFAESFQSKARATQTLDKLSRMICPKLRHFVVFSSVSCGRGNAGQTNYGMANSVMERVCEKRVEEGLPGLAIQWGAVGDVGIVADMQEDDKELIIGGTLQQKISSCLDELDKFLLQSRPIVSSMVVAEKKAGSSGLGSLTETISSILDIKDMKVVSQNTSLAELGIDSMMTVEIKQTLEREFDIFLTPQEIQNLTLAKLNKMSNANVSDDTTQDEKTNAEGPNAIKFLVGILKDKDFVLETCFELSTKKQKSTTEVFLVPGIDGCGTIFNHLAPNIKLSTTVLQYNHFYNTNNIDATNVISETTNHLTNLILPKLKGEKDFVMIGYSFGSIIAIEITRKLEAMNFKGRLILIDGAPEQIRTMYKHIISDSNDADLQNIVLTNIMEIYSSETSEKIVLELEKYNTWEEKYNIFAKQFLVMNTSLSPANLKTLCTTVYKHSIAIRYYDPSTLPPIKSPIILLKPTHSLYTSMIEEDYGLLKVSENVVKVHYVEGTHVTILKNEEVLAAINGEPPFIL